MYRDALLYWYGSEKLCPSGCELHLCPFISADSNSCLQDAHPTEGLGQVRFSMDIIDQLMALTSGNTNPEVAALVLSPQKGRWGENSDPTTPLAGRTFSDHSEEVSPMCPTGNLDDPEASTMPLLSQYLYLPYYGYKSQTCPAKDRKKLRLPILI